MIKGRIIQVSMRLPDGGTTEFYEVETLRGGIPHRSKERGHKTEEDARRHAEAECDEVDPELGYEQR